jgi:hypothetical protein
LEVSGINTATDPTNGECRLLILLLENHSLFLDVECHLILPENAKGQLHYFYMRKLHMGTKGLQKLLYTLQKKGLVERRDLKRGRSFAMRYLLTSQGKLVARKLLDAREDHPRVLAERHMRVLVKSEDGSVKEESLFAISPKGAIISLNDVIIKKETRTVPVRKEYILVKNDIVIVTKQVSGETCKIIIKGLKRYIVPEVYEKAKRVCLLTEVCDDFECSIQTPLSKECVSSITDLTHGDRARKLLDEWKTTTKGVKH